MRGKRACVALVLAALAQGCASTTPEWAESINPCCGQDLIAQGIEPPQDRCADIVVDQETAFRLMKDLSGGAVAQWEVRLIPGGPACIWRLWPGEVGFKPENVQPDWVGNEPARQDSAAVGDTTNTGEADGD
jgi:hypothetical protein